MSKEEINLTQNVEKCDGINVNRGSGTVGTEMEFTIKLECHQKMLVQKNFP